MYAVIPVIVVLQLHYTGKSTKFTKWRSLHIVYISGITSWKTHEIVIDRKASSQNAIIHEIGHWASHHYHGGLDSALLFSAYYHEWEDLYREFGGSELNYNMPEEFAASAFDYYVTEPERMKAVAPETYKMISSFVGYKK